MDLYLEFIDRMIAHGIDLLCGFGDFGNRSILHETIITNSTVRYEYTEDVDVTLEFLYRPRTILLLVTLFGGLAIYAFYDVSIY